MLPAHAVGLWCRSLIQVQSIQKLREVSMDRENRIMLVTEGVVVFRTSKDLEILISNARCGTAGVDIAEDAKSSANMVGVSALIYGYNFQDVTTLILH